MITTPIQLRFNDIDLQGHMYNGQYQHIFDLGKNEYFEQVIGIGAMDGDNAVITASSTTNFYIPVGLRDRIIIKTGVDRLGTKSFTVFQQMINADTEEIVADSRTVMVAYNVLTRQSFEIPSRWREKIVAAGDIPE